MCPSTITFFALSKTQKILSDEFDHLPHRILGGLKLGMADYMRDSRIDSVYESPNTTMTGPMRIFLILSQRITLSGLSEQIGEQVR
jgi:hypothetical protein